MISIPLSFFGGIGGASSRGILVKGSNYLEALAQTKYVVFDKTGTLTKGVFQVTGVHPASGFCEGLEKAGGSRTEGTEAGLSVSDKDEEAVSEKGQIIIQMVEAAQEQKDERDGEDAEKLLLELAAFAESYSTHPISRSLKEACGKNIDQTKVTDVEEISGHGVTACVCGRRVSAGNEKLMRKLALAIRISRKCLRIVYEKLLCAQYINYYSKCQPQKVTKSQIKEFRYNIDKVIKIQPGRKQ